MGEGPWPSVYGSLKHFLIQTSPPTTHGGEGAWPSVYVLCSLKHFLIQTSPPTTQTHVGEGAWPSVYEASNTFYYKPARLLHMKKGGGGEGGVAHTGYTCTKTVEI